MKHPEYFVKLVQRTLYGGFFGGAAWYLWGFFKLKPLSLWPFVVGGLLFGFTSAAIEWYLKERYG